MNDENVEADLARAAGFRERKRKRRTSYPRRCGLAYPSGMNLTFKRLNQSFVGDSAPPPNEL